MKKLGFMTIVAFGIVAFLILMTVPLEAWKVTDISPKVPLPYNYAEIKITPAAADLPKEIAAFPGRWEDVWEDGTPAVLIIKKISATKSELIYGWGTTRYGLGDFLSLSARVWIDKGKAYMEAYLNQYVTLIFEMDDSFQVIHGRSIRKNGSGQKITLKRITED